MRAVQNRNVSLEDECKNLSAKVDTLNKQLEAKDKVSHLNTINACMHK